MHPRSLETQPGLLVRERSGRFVVYHDSSEAYAEVLASLLPDPDRLFGDGEAIQSPWQSAATDKTVVKIRDKSYFFKRYNCLDGGYPLKNAFRNSRASKSWWAAWKFMEQGLSTPRPIVCLEERRFRLLGRSYLLFEFLEGSKSLLDLWGELSDNQRAQLLSLLGTQIGEMHRQGILHGDLNWRNILVRETSASLEIYLVDLDGCRFVGRVSGERAEKDLSHFSRDLKRNYAAEQDMALFVAAWEKAFRSS